MKRVWFLCCLLSLLWCALSAWPCSQAIGYFHQVTRLQGDVVGVNKGDFRHMIRWMRLRERLGNLSLDLYEYRWPIAQRSDMRLVKSVKSAANGHFDFGTIPDGHYALVIDDPWGGSSWYDVEITQRIKATDSVKIDVSPVYPDCSGGHEFIGHS